MFGILGVRPHSQLFHGDMTPYFDFSACMCRHSCAEPMIALPAAPLFMYCALESDLRVQIVTSDMEVVRVWTSRNTLSHLSATSESDVVHA